MTLARFKDLCIDATVGRHTAEFWAGALGLDVDRADPPVSLREPGEGGLTLWVNEVPEPHTVKQRVHLDVHTARVEDLLELGASVRREPTAAEAWWSLADPEGGEFCAFVRDEVPRHRLYEIVVDSADPHAQARWWQVVLGGELESSDDADSAAIENVPGLLAEYVVFARVPEPKTVKNRVHWDVTSDDLEGLVRRGARVLRQPIDGEPWHVLADPEGNEFCVFSP